MPDYKGPPVNPNEAITKRFVEENDATKFKERMNHRICVSYSGVVVNIWQCNVHDNEFMVEAQALGTILHLIYFINSTSIDLQTLLQNAFQDFGQYVVHARVEEHDS